MTQELSENTAEARTPSQMRRPSTVNSMPTVRDVEAIESDKARIERLGRQRPEKFRSLWEEAGFIYAVVMSQAITEYFVSGFNVLLPTLISRFDISASQSTWPASSFSLVVSAFLLPFGRVADMYGGYPVYVAGVVWLAVWSAIAGFSRNAIMMDFCRALQGLGPAAYLPSSLMLLGSIYRPGPRKNLVFSLYGAAAPLGFFIGIFFAGIAAEYTSWAVYFWIGAGLTASTGVIAYFCIPSDISERKALGVKMDWPGSLLIPAGLILVVFAITDSPHAPKGWATPYIYFLLIIGLIFLGFAIYVEGWVSPVPLLPPDMFKVKYMKPLFIALFFSYGSLGVFMLYSTLYMTDIMGAGPMQLVAWFTPMALGGCIISTLGGFILHVVPGTVILTVAGVSWIVAPLLFAIAPFGANYWFYTFWSMICATVAIDTTFTVSNVFITTNLPLRHQGLAGALINSILQLGIAFFLSLSEVVANNTRHKGVASSYKTVFWFEVGMAATALFLLVGFVKMKAAESDLTADEKAALRDAAAADVSENLRREGLVN